MLNLDYFYQQAHDLVGLHAPISEDEVWCVIKEMSLDKAPGPDGFTGRFYKSCWAIIKNDIMAVIGVIHGGDTRRLHLLNSAYISQTRKMPQQSATTNQSVSSTASRS